MRKSTATVVAAALLSVAACAPPKASSQDDSPEPESTAPPLFVAHEDIYEALDYSGIYVITEGQYCEPGDYYLTRREVKRARKAGKMVATSPSGDLGIENTAPPGHDSAYFPCERYYEDVLAGLE